MKEFKEKKLERVETKDVAANDLGLRVGNLSFEGDNPGAEAHYLDGDSRYKTYSETVRERSIVYEAWDSKNENGLFSEVLFEY